MNKRIKRISQTADIFHPNNTTNNIPTISAKNGKGLQTTGNSIELRIKKDIQIIRKLYGKGTCTIHEIAMRYSNLAGWAGNLNDETPIKNRSYQIALEEIKRILCQK